MLTVTGNLLDVTVGTIAHQTNCMGVCGAGVALAIAKAYPEWAKTYWTLCSIEGKNLLGRAHLTKVTNNLVVGSLFGQLRPGRGLMTDYVALSKALSELSVIAPNPIYLPYGIGCGLAGGNWNIVQSLIEEYCPSATLIKLP